MEENNNENQPIYEDENEEKIKQVGKDAAKKAAKEIGKATKKAMKELLKKLIKLIPPYVWLIIVVVILIIILLASFWYAIKGETYESISNIARVTTEDESGNIRKITNLDENNRQLVIDTDLFIQQVDELVKSNKISPKLLGLTNGDYSTLITFLQAEAVSAFPDLRKREKIGTPVGKDELQGIVQFKRKFEDDTEQLLEYMPYTQFRKEIAKLGKKLDNEETQEQIYFTKDEVETAYNNLKTYFTLDSNYDVIIVSLVSSENKIQYSDYAKKEEKKDEYTYDYYVNVTKANYQSIIQKYTMPFEFPLALLMETSNPTFCEEVAKLAMPSRQGEDTTGNNFMPKIVIDVQDITTFSYTKQEYSYKANFKLQDYIDYEIITKKINIKPPKISTEVISRESAKYDPYPIEVEKVEDIVNYKVEENWVNTTTDQLCVSEAITWIADYTSTYTNKQQTDNTETNSKEDDDEEYTEVSDYHEYLKKQKFNYNLKGGQASGNLSVECDVTSEEKKILEKDTDKNTKIATTVTTTKYNKTSSKIKEKWERFLSLLKIDSTLGQYNINDRNKNDTKIKYEEKDSKNMVSPEDNLLSGEVALYSFLSSNSKTVTLEQIMRDLIAIYTGKMKPEEAKFDFSIYEPGDFITPGRGGTSGIDGVQGQIYDFLLSKGMSSIGAAAVMGNIQQESSFNTSASNGTHFGLCQWGGGRWTNLQNFAGSTLWTDLNAQLDFLWYELETTYSNVKEQLMNATDLQSAVDYFCRHYEICGNYETEVPKRYGYALNWYEQWEEGHSGYNEAFDAGVISKMISWATSQIGKSKFYSAHRRQYVQSDGYCAAFVKSAYYEAGLSYINGNAIDIPHPNTIQYDSSGKVDCSSIPIGACIVSSGTSSYGHVALYVGNGYVIEAGGSTVVKNKVDNSYGRGKFLGWGYAMN